MVQIEHSKRVIDSTELCRTVLLQTARTNAFHSSQDKSFQPWPSSNAEAAAAEEASPASHSKARVPMVEAIDSSSQDEGFQPSPVGLHSSIHGKVSVSEGKAINSLQEASRTWPSSSAAAAEASPASFPSSPLSTMKVSEAETIDLVQGEFIRLNKNASEVSSALHLKPRVSKVGIPMQDEGFQSWPSNTDVAEASLASFPSSVPSFKRIPGTRFIIDGFRYAGPWSMSYFLSHFHSDHYTGLTSSWNKGIIFCSHITARLVTECIKVPTPFVFPLPMGEPVNIDSCHVTLVEANHCPGAVQMLFQVPTEKSNTYMRYAHTGDMRYSSHMNADPSLCDFVGADAVFLDTTYCNPKFVFPTQSESVSYIAETIYTMKKESDGKPEALAFAYDDSGKIHKPCSGIEDLQAHPVTDCKGVQTDPIVDSAEPQVTTAREVEDLPGESQCCKSNLEDEGYSECSAEDTSFTGSEKTYMEDSISVSKLQQESRGYTLFLISTYVIGKEKILLAVAKRCNCLIYVDEKKFSILKCLDLENLDVFTTTPSATNVHVVSWNFLGETWPYFRPNFRNMEELLKASGCCRVIGFVPTGWTYETKKKAFSVRRKGPLEIHLVPYSEHSNYDELRQYVAFLRPKEIIPTVGLEGGDVDGKAVAAMRKHFRNLVDETASKRRFLKGFSRKAGDESRKIEENKPTSLKVLPEFSKLDVSSGDYGDNIVEAMDMQGFPNVADLQTGLKQVSSASEDLNTREFARAAFGKGAKKRQRESNKTAESEDSVSKMAKTEKTIAEDSKSLPVLRRMSSENELGTREISGGNVSIYSRQKEEELRTVLPMEVSEEQVRDLLLKAKGDLDLAVTLFFEDSVFYVKEQHGQEYGKNIKELPFAETGIAEHGNSCLLTEGVSTGTQTGSTTQKAPSKSSILESRNFSTATVDTGRKTAKSAVLGSNKKGKGSQSSILTFFQKTDSSASCATNLEKSSPCKVQLARPKQAQKALRDCGVLAGQDPDLREGLDQMLTILGGAIPKEKTLTLLEQAHGDVGAALDLYYRDNCSSLLETNSKDVVPGSGLSQQRLSKEDICEMEETSGGKEVQAVDSNVLRPVQSTEEQSCMQKEVQLEVKTCCVAMPIWEYKPIEHACWTSVEPAPYVHLARTFDLVEQESGRLKTSDMLCNMFRSLLALSPEAVLPAVYLATNRIAPDYENVDLNIGGSIVSAAIVEATGTQKSKIREMYNSMGDLGDVAQACRQTQSLLVAPRILSIQQVFSTLLQISKETGSGSSLRKKSLILGLLRACREKEMKYIVRTLVQNMRIGAMMKSVLPALAQGIVLHNSLSTGKSEQLKAELQSASTAIVEAFNFMPNLNILVPALLQDGIKTVLSNVTVSPGIPVKPMLAKITNGITEVFKRFHGISFTCEYKYDGQRAQVHLIKDGSIKIFSRNCEDTTSRFPDVLEIVRMALRPGIQDLIFDAEIVAVDRGNNNKLMAFQHLSTRERGRSGIAVSIENIKVDVCLFVFDLMYANGKPLVKMPFSERRKWMHECFTDGQAGCFGFANQVTIEANEANLELLGSVTKVEGFLEEAINSSCEGMMVKALDEESTYTPSKRSDSWLKVKRDYIEGLHDTLDLVPIGAWYGNGRKAGWYSPFLLACYDSDREEFQSVCRVMSGFTDAFYKQMKEFFSGERMLQQKPTYYHTLEDPDVWFSAELVWEIRGADLTVSPVHQAAVGLVHPSRGISLRFPRFIKQRSDKKPENASSPSDIADLFHQQSRKLDIPAAHGNVHEHDNSSQ